ncbi:AmmeMemoRadiSam system radical SAM enzyme [Maridesulfovibrio salexigens]|uniref:Radical SAM domain protein n=1 Tax=Maridesulfovibrio salexigens (strain ATCC 14822 / DSM 2638 / NCIMB 8403 / VKM B-1763) TaxID=526222 RepID=C6C1L0_MARSD|nr:AmmeMemoRadiSam system radical SAM enzyme [Maridesulfovibrio salexigens]ACS81185.1 Radical SAM domain protein [Maridesulfovibrio salexigens DSM 2638]
MLHPARLWKPLKDGKVQCRLCSHFCIIDEQEHGKCGVRQNVDGQLMTKTYELVAALNVDPVEKKPLYHFLPGTETFSLGTQGCNFGCTFCQNASLSQHPKTGREITGQKVTPEILVEATIAHKCDSISYTYSEPTIFFELMQDTARLAHIKGLKNIMVSNGFQSPDCIEELTGLIDAANIDLKAFNDVFYRDTCGGRLNPVLDNLKHMKTNGWWVEVTTLLIPGKNDSPDELKEMAAFIANELGKEVPWHISRFHPDYKMQDCPVTPMEALQRARKAGTNAGLEYVYIGNIPGNESSATFCPDCHKELIKRFGFEMTKTGLSDGMCKYCGCKINGVF